MRHLSSESRASGPADENPPRSTPNGSPNRRSGGAEPSNLGRFGIGKQMVSAPPQKVRTRVRERRSKILSNCTLRHLSNESQTFGQNDRKWIQNAPKWIQFRFGSILDPFWIHFRSILGPVIYISYLRLVPFWSNFDPRAPQIHQNGTRMEPKWNQNGTKWNQNGTEA